MALSAKTQSSASSQPPPKAEPTPSLPQLKRDARAAAAAGQHIEAIELYRRILAITPDDWKTVDHLGDAFAKIGDLTRAAEHYRRAAEHYESVQHPAMAIALWAKMARLFPKMLDFHVKLAGLHEQAGHPADAIDEYQVVIEGIRKDAKGLLGESLVAPYEARIAALRSGCPDAAAPDAVPAASVAAPLALATEGPGQAGVGVSDGKRCPHCGGVLL